MRFVIEGPPRTAKNHQQIRRTRRGVPFITKGDVARTWQDEAVRQLQQQFRAPVTRRLNPPETGRMNLRALIYRDRRTGDTVNYLQAICDALQAAGVVADDKQIETFDGSRPLVDRRCPRVEIELTTLGDA